MGNRSFKRGSLQLAVADQCLLWMIKTLTLKERKYG
jgi:hypothetical protein